MCVRVLHLEFKQVEFGQLDFKMFHVSQKTPQLKKEKRKTTWELSYFCEGFNIMKMCKNVTH